MDSPKLRTTVTNSDHRVKIEEEEKLPKDVFWEEGVNPLGFLAVVIDEGKDSVNCASESKNDLSTAAGTVLLEQQRPTITISDDDDDEEEELEPVAAVDVLPVREEDFFPEGLVQDVPEPCRSPWITSRSLTSEIHQPWNSQEHQLLGAENAHMLPQGLWAMQQNFFLGAQPTHQLFLNHPNKAWSTQNQLENVESLSPNNSELKNSHQKYDNKYHKKNPELARIRNREYARRYRLTHAALLRERQKEYVKRRRECKKLALIETNSEQSNNVPISEKSNESTSLLNKTSIKIKSFEKRDRKTIMAIKSKNSEINEENEILILN